MNYFSKIPLFEQISTLDQQKMTACFNAPPRKFQTGETIYTDEDNTKHLGILYSGKAQMVRLNIDGSAALLERLTAGSLFGEYIAYSPMPTDSISVIAETSCEAIFLPWQKVIYPCKHDCDCHRVLVNNLFVLISKKAAALSERVEILSCRSIKEKILCYFRILSHHEGKLEFTLPFSLSALAEYLCTDRSAMMRELRKLNDAGILSSKGNQFKLSPDHFDIS